MEEHRHNGRLRQHGTRQAVTNVDDTDPIIIYEGNWGRLRTTGVLLYVCLRHTGFILIAFAELYTLLSSQ